MKVRHKFTVGEEAYLAQQENAYTRGLPYRKLSQGECRKYKITYVGSWGNLEGRMITKKGSLSTGIYFLNALDMMPASWLEESLEKYL